MIGMVAQDTNDHGIHSYKIDIGHILERGVIEDYQM